MALASTGLQKLSVSAEKLVAWAFLGQILDVKSLPLQMLLKAVSVLRSLGTW